ncbi:M48 family metallopeptidase [Legionella spiritensis]|uniref:Zinc metalloprotease n=1 Tax=Legionella spiritensis TaxID=452 RepID=A0A0W0Z948_LEGSP|nr:SprT family zinc-dependent metalloprotease [Legionella spiritensis]KTD65286.1 zinc metalloprotease [Legionella spiritensis]SNV30087.1 metal-dependent hydrolase [Legionella spiritensis]VEG91858.1 metal-dependent hydrolase [Legionella spiritensis]
MSSLIEIAGITCELVRKPIKNLHLGVYPPDGRVRISAPLGLSNQAIGRFITHKKTWILTRQKHIQERKITESPSLTDGASCLFQGQIHTLRIKETDSGRPSCIMQDHHLWLSIKTGASQLDKEKILHRWYRDQLQQQLTTLVPAWEKIIGISVQQIGIKKMKTRWGSCNPRAKRIWINLTLIQKPLSCLEYVLVHEMIHFLESGHNRRFYQWMEHFLPDWKQRHQMLRQAL